MLETIMLKKSLLFFVGLLTATSALAGSAVTQADLNLRTGPGVGYQPVTTVPAGRTVAVIGCLDLGRWCDVSWNGYRGWLSGTYLGAVHVRVPVITYDPSSTSAITSVGPFTIREQQHSAMQGSNTGFTGEWIVVGSAGLIERLAAERNAEHRLHRPQTSVLTSERASEMLILSALYPGRPQYSRSGD
ncbi:SH3 domain-containing protein [Rhizobium laguerreae]|uniref:SH3 domain-containing protein n=1 Tax=Rhizobium laguerreae TaxID=1076926 RepID=UPI001A097F00|nr:SH3 domain-containing protein [Rhizobium laguerreae]